MVLNANFQMIIFACKRSDFRSLKSYKIVKVCFIKKDIDKLSQVRNKINKNSNETQHHWTCLTH